MAIQTSPGQELAVLGASKRVVLATSDLLDLVVLERLDNGGTQNNGVILASAHLNTSLGKVVQTPGPNGAILAKSKAVVGSASNAIDLVLGKTHALGDKGGKLVALDDTASKLVLLAAAPGDNDTLVVKSENVVGTGSKGRDVLQCGKVGGSLLDLDLVGETEDTVTRLENVSYWSRHAAFR